MCPTSIVYRIPSTIYRIPSTVYRPPFLQNEIRYLFFSYPIEYQPIDGAST